MARAPVTRAEALLIGGAVLAALLCALLLRTPMDGLDEQAGSLFYSLRGMRTADTNIVIVYVDQEAIKSLQWPVRRNFYALMVKALTDLRVRAVGIEAVFEDPRTEYPEYDDLLSGVIRSAGNVVLTAYFDSVSARVRAPSGESLRFSLFDYPAVLYDPPAGLRPHLPLPQFREVAAGVGHVNIEGNADVDLFIAGGHGTMASFGTELLRVANRTSRGGLVADGSQLVCRLDTGSLACSGADDGRVRINFPGNLRSFTAYPFLEVLRAYDALRSDLPQSLPVVSLRGKIILVGLVAEGRSEFLRTPVDERLPAIALHAAFLDNALGNRFLRSTPAWLSLLLSLVIGCASGYVVLVLRTPYNRIAVAAGPILLAVISFALFAAAGVQFPLAGPVLAALLPGGAGLIARQRRARERVRSLESEKSAILERLRDREAKVAMLEQELVTLGASKSRNRTEELLDEIRRYKSEIRTLSSQADDMDVFESDTGELARSSGEFEGIVFESGGPLKRIVEFVAKVAASEAPVLILGESGTGKELIAHALHRRSNRSGAQFVAVNCGALSESLLESELFGHEKGAFTGAVKERLGRFELADGGTIFLDEIGEVSEGFQLKLLRVLQEGDFERVGGTKTLKTNVRVVAATNKDLRELVRQRKFREDLYYRLNVLSVALPTLRERAGDIPLLIEHFLVKEGGEMKISKNAMDALRNFPWPGNVRELESAIKRGVLLARAERRTMITMKDLGEEIAASAHGAAPVGDQVLESLREKGFSRSSVSETADELGGLNRGTVAEYLRGECLRAFAECTFDLDKAVRHISLTTDEAVNDRVRKKFEDYLASIADAVVISQPWENARASLRPKAKNLPQRYHLYLDQVGEAFYRGVWRSPGSGL
jgi:transcriptional regulator with GAF, ATPase, and Fis domain/CHASE2 domain-containing sensor protein